MFISCPRRQETSQRNAAQGKEGLDRKKANMPHFFALRHPLSLKDPSHLSAIRQTKGEDLWWENVIVLKGFAKKGTVRLGFNTLTACKRKTGIFLTSQDCFGFRNYGMAK